MTDWGTVIVKRWQDALLGDQVSIVRADPKVLISDEMLKLIQEGFTEGRATLDGDVLTLNAANGKWIYRIRGYDPLLRAWRMEWPD